MALQVLIASPCTEKWESMTGDERVRHCARCRLNVYDVKELTEVEVRALFSKNEGKMCGRVFRRPDGTVLTKDCPTGLAAVRRKALVAVAMTLAMLLAVVGYRSKSCPTPSNSSGATWFDRTVGARFVGARESLRATRTLGPIINELFPPTTTMMAGAMIALPPPSPVAPAE